MEATDAIERIEIESTERLQWKEIEAERLRFNDLGVGAG